MEGGPRARPADVVVVVGGHSTGRHTSALSLSLSLPLSPPPSPAAARPTAKALEEKTGSRRTRPDWASSRVGTWPGWADVREDTEEVACLSRTFSALGGSVARGRRREKASGRAAGNTGLGQAASGFTDEPRSRGSSDTGHRERERGLWGHGGRQPTHLPRATNLAQETGLLHRQSPVGYFGQAQWHVSGSNDVDTCKPAI